MKIQLLSDLHLEAHPHFVPTPAPDADLLVLAGDVGSYQSGSQLVDADFGLARFSPLHGWPVPVLFDAAMAVSTYLDYPKMGTGCQDTAGNVSRKVPNTPSQA